MQIIQDAYINIFFVSLTCVYDRNSAGVGCCPSGMGHGGVIIAGCSSGSRGGRRAEDGLSLVCVLFP